jgi:hypothetical protein
MDANQVSKQDSRYRKRQSNSITRCKLILGAQSAKYEFALSNTTRTTFAFDVCFVWKLAPLAVERSGFFIENLSCRLTLSSTY